MYDSVESDLEIALAYTRMFKHSIGYTQELRDAMQHSLEHIFRAEKEIQSRLSGPEFGNPGKS